MALQFCPSCTKRIATDAQVCPKCGHTLPPGWAESQKKVNLQALWVGLGLVVALFIGLTYCNKSTTVTSNPCGERLMALIMAEKFVRLRLKAPSSAEFAATSDASIAMKSCGQWIVGSHVDAQNAFGARIRTRFLITLQRDSEGTWRLVDLTFLK